MSEFETRSYQQGDEKQLVPLLQESFSGWPFFDLTCSPLDHWRWRYLDNPQHSNLIVEILHGDIIIAVNHNLLHYMMINRRKTLSSYGTDACVHPEYQGQGLYGTLVDNMFRMVEEAGVEFKYMITVHQRVIESSRQRISTPNSFPHSVKYLERIEDLNHHLEMKEATGEYMWRLKHVLEQLKSKPIRPPETEIQTIDNFGEEATTLIDEVNKSLEYIKYRTPEYLNWRYLDPRGGNYNVKAHLDKGVMDGYGVFRINRLDNYPVGYIVDLLTSPNRAHVAEDILLHGLNYFQENSVNQVISQVVEGSRYEEIHKQYGFQGGEANRHIFYNHYNNPELDIQKIAPEKIHFVFGDLTGI